ncbi:MAG: DUF1211 domain-containing protein [Cyclobacteriaceae bacterium]|nr:DUF1211 domain-containing protein [Cyclobacteriaceae bacterium]
MVRRLLIDTAAKQNKEFNLRGEAQTRIETLSDAVFAFAIALLVLSSSVPERYDELILSMQDIVPFGVCIALLMLIWYQHFIFFIRYGLQDAKIIVLNTILLFLILFYVYPLKFLFRVLYKLFYALFTGDRAISQELFTVTIKPEDAPDLMAIYGIGASLIFILLALMYWYALKKARSLKLNPKEIFETRTSIYKNVFMGIVPLISALIAFVGVGDTGTTFTLSGISYWLYMLVMPTFSIMRERVRKKKWDR